MRYLAALFLLILIPTLSSCALPQPAETKPQADEETLTEQVVEKPIASREAIFVCDNQPPSLKPEIILKLNSEPVLLSTGYVRLLGVISDDRGAAEVLFDLAGKSVGLKLFDEIGGYRLVKIFNQTAYLRKEEGDKK